MAEKVAGEKYYKIDGQLLEIKRQIRQPNGYPFDAHELNDFLQRGIEGKFHEGKVNWRERDKVIYFPVTSDGKTDKKLVKHLESKGVLIDARTKKFLSRGFKTTKGKTYLIAVIPGGFLSNDCTTLDILNVAYKCKFVKPSAEAVCLICDALTDTEIRKMGLYRIIIAYKSNGRSILFSIGPRNGK